MKQFAIFTLAIVAGLVVSGAVFLFLILEYVASCQATFEGPIKDQPTRWITICWDWRWSRHSPVASSIYYFGDASGMIFGVLAGLVMGLTWGGILGYGTAILRRPRVLILLIAVIVILGILVGMLTDIFCWSPMRLCGPFPPPPNLPPA